VIEVNKFLTSPTSGANKASLHSSRKLSLVDQNTCSTDLYTKPNGLMPKQTAASQVAVSYKIQHPLSPVEPKGNLAEIIKMQLMLAQ
jgi:hypothetical protein